MTIERKFSTVDVLSAATGRLLGKFDKMHELLEWMAGEPVWTHQLGRVAQEAAPVLVKRHPLLAVTISESGNVTEDNYAAWRDKWIDRHGPTMIVPRLTANDHERIDPISELAEKAPADRIMQVRL